MTDTEKTTLAAQLAARFGDTLAIHCVRNETVAELAPADLIAVASALRDEPDFRFGEMIDLCGVDYFGYGQVEWNTETATSTGFSRGVEGEALGRFDWEHRPAPAAQPAPAADAAADAAGQGVSPRFVVVLELLSIEHNRRLRLRVPCADDSLPIVPSVTSVWAGANWFEREAFDLYGIIFDGHPDLRRILTDYGFVGHPFRKDFPLIGNVEVRYDPEQKRVIYQPVTITPRLTVPRTIRDNAGLAQARAEAAEHWREN